MRFCFNVRLTDEDYLLFNEFAAKHSPITKKTALMSKILVAVIFIIGAADIFISQGVNPVSVAAALVFVVLFIILALAFDKINGIIIKLQVRAILKKDKKPYSPESVLEFYDDLFREIAPDNKSEMNYTAIDKISVIRGRYIFIFIDSVRGYLLPFTCFDNGAEEKEFIAFLSGICNKTEFFDKI